MNYLSTSSHDVGTLECMPFVVFFCERTVRMHLKVVVTLHSSVSDLLGLGLDEAYHCIKPFDMQYRRLVCDPLLGDHKT